ncbi:hypothetical protein Baya_14145 [Bagarius yarrelli]|uniref:Uncharacterized protein n=1 Tax=Bagarius yarrelli TaxID=175774 RepID=A0A556V7Q4_BAGYA|nr:hypothetical protein Baya_14145 [Bagarius yarrelli]
MIKDLNLAQTGLELKSTGLEEDTWKINHTFEVGIMKLQPCTFKKEALSETHPFPFLQNAVLRQVPLPEAARRAGDVNPSEVSTDDKISDFMLAEHREKKVKSRKDLFFHAAGRDLTHRWQPHVVTFPASLKGKHWPTSAGKVTLQVLSLDHSHTYTRASNMLANSLLAVMLSLSDLPHHNKVM